MACVYKRRKQYWISYYVNGQQIRQSLHTTNKRVALAEKKRPSSTSCLWVTFRWPVN